MILDTAAEKGVRIEGIFNTHGHIDHVGAVSRIRTALGIPFAIHSGEKAVLDSLPAQARMFGMSSSMTAPVVDQWLDDNAEVPVGNLRGNVLWTPGHTPGGVCFSFDKIIFAGDTLFSGSVGRTDLPGGDTQQLLSAIKNRLLCLHEDTVVYCGHGPPTRISTERDHNPFLSSRWQMRGQF